MNAADHAVSPILSPSIVDNLVSIASRYPPIMLTFRSLMETWGSPREDRTDVEAAIGDTSADVILGSWRR